MTGKLLTGAKKKKKKKKKNTLDFHFSIQPKDRDFYPSITISVTRSTPEGLTEHRQEHLILTNTMCWK